MAEGQEKVYYAPGENKERLSNLPQVDTLTKKGYDVLLFTEDVDEFVPQTLMTYMEKSFLQCFYGRPGLADRGRKKQAEEKAEEMKGLLTFVKETLGDRVKEVKLSSELGSHPVCMTPAEGMSFEMEKYMKRANPEFAFPVGRVLELNPEHEAVQAMQKAMTEDPEKGKGLRKASVLSGTAHGGTAAGRPLCLHRAGVQTDEVILTGKEKGLLLPCWCDKNIPTERKGGFCMSYTYSYISDALANGLLSGIFSGVPDADRHCHLCIKRSGALHHRQAPGAEPPVAGLDSRGQRVDRGFAFRSVSLCGQRGE